MREIKFKALDRTTGQWHYGEFGIADFETLNTWSMPTFWLMIESGQLDPETVGQYTGLKDKNSKEIYEGDIVNDSERIEVSWNPKFASFCLYSKKWMFAHFFGEAVNPAEHCEVIGNISENKDLLK